MNKKETIRENIYFIPEHSLYYLTYELCESYNIAYVLPAGNLKRQISGSWIIAYNN